MSRDFAMPHPGAILREEFLEPLNLSIDALAAGLGVPPDGVDAICAGQGKISDDLALRLGRYFSVDPRWFLNMQATYDRHFTEETIADIPASTAPRAAVG
jgi:addiction module HigA family antidote